MAVFTCLIVVCVDRLAECAYPMVACGYPLADCTCPNGGRALYLESIAGEASLRGRAPLCRMGRRVR